MGDDQERVGRRERERGKETVRERRGRESGELTYGMTLYLYHMASYWREKRA